MREPTEADFQQAIECIKQGKIIGYPTEAVYGLGCDPFSIDAISELLQIKFRAIKHGFILIASDWEQLEPLVLPIEPRRLALVHSTWPGPVTWIFPASPIVPRWICGEHSGVAVRVTAHPIAKKLCELYGAPIVSTSANVSGHPPLRDYRTMQMSFGEKLGFIMPGKVGGELKPTEIRDAITGESIR